jgi:hypothetical protein
MDERQQLIGGRPYGGLAIMWSRALAGCIRPVRTDNTRLCGVTLSISSRKILVLNAYLPCDNHSTTTVDALFQAVLDDALCLWVESDADTLIFGGDLNTDPRRGNAHSTALEDFVLSVDGSFA